MMLFQRAVSSGVSSVRQEHRQRLAQQFGGGFPSRDLCVTRFDSHEAGARLDSYPGAPRPPWFRWLTRSLGLAGRHPTGFLAGLWFNVNPYEYVKPYLTSEIGLTKIQTMKTPIERIRQLRTKVSEGEAA